MTKVIYTHNAETQRERSSTDDGVPAAPPRRTGIDMQVMERLSLPYRVIWHGCITQDRAGRANIRYMPSVATSHLSTLQKSILVSMYCGVARQGINRVSPLIAAYLEPALLSWRGEDFTQNNANTNERSIVSASLRKLEARGLITRWTKDRLKTSLSPGRTAYVAFTDEGLALARELFLTTVENPEKFLNPEPRDKTGRIIGMLEHVKEKVELINEGALPPEDANLLVEILASAIESLQDGDVGVASPPK